MIDAEYFRAELPKQIAAAAETPIVDVFLRNGHTHRVRAVAETAEGYVVLEAFRLAGSHDSQTARWQEPAGSAGTELSTFQVTVAYEAIAHVVVDATPPTATRRAGTFGFSTRPAP